MLDDLVSGQCYDLTYVPTTVGIIDELPTIYFRGLDYLIATARSNKVAVCLGFPDISQLEHDYGDKKRKSFRIWWVISSRGW